MKTSLPSIKSPAFVVSFVLLAATAIGMRTLPRYMDIYLSKKPVEARRHMREVSPRLPSWQQVGQDRQEKEDILKALGTTNTITRYYLERNPPAGQDPIVMELHLAYYTGMVDTVPHVSDRCMVGGGWQPLTGSVVLPVELDTASWRRVENVPAGVPSDVAGTLSEVRLPGPEYTDFPGSRVVLPYGFIAPSEKDGQKNGVVQMRISDFVDPKTKSVSVIGHFFIANHRLTPSANEVRQLAFRLTDDYAYYVKVQVSVSAAGVREGRTPRVGTPHDLAKVAGQFVSEALPEVMLCLPDWVRLESERAKVMEAAGKAGEKSGSTGG